MGKYLYVRFRGMYLSRYNPLIQLPLNTSTRSTPPVKCPTKSRIVITTGEGITITACPLPQDYSRRHVVEVFSSGWHSKSIFHQHELSPVLSFELLSDPEDWEEYSFSYLELTRRPPLAEGIGMYPLILIDSRFLMIILILQKTVNIHVLNCKLVLMHQHGVMEKFIVLRDMMSPLHIAQLCYACQQKY